MTLFPEQIAELYVAMWNETEAVARRSAIAAFFAPDASHYVKTLQAKGHAALEKRVMSSHVKNVVENGNRFRAAPGAQQLRNIVTFNWEMHPEKNPSQVLAIGLEYIELGEDGRARTDYQFIVS
jgi:hypothetical protein